MAVHFNEDKKIFRLDTETSTYLMGLTPEGYLGHIYYGELVYIKQQRITCCVWKSRRTHHL